MELRSPTSHKRQKYADAESRMRPSSPDMGFNPHFRPPSPDERYSLRHETSSRSRGPATPPPMIPQQNQRRYSGTSSQHRMTFSSHSPPASRYSQRSRAISPPPSPTPVSRRRKPSISPPARYKREFFNDAAEASSSDDCELSEPYEVEHRKSRMLKHGLGARLWTQWEQHREMCCLSHSYFVKHLLTLHRKHCQWVNSLSQEQSSDDSSPPAHAHKRRKKKKRRHHARVAMSPDHSVGGSISPPYPQHRHRVIDDPHDRRYQYPPHHMQHVPMSPPPTRHHRHYSMSPSPPPHYGGGGGGGGYQPHPNDFPPHNNMDIPSGRQRSSYNNAAHGGGGGGHQPHPAVGGHVMMRPISPTTSHTSRHSGSRPSNPRPPPVKRPSNASSDESGQVSEGSSAAPVPSPEPAAEPPADGPRLNTSGEKIGLCIRNLPLRSSDTSLRDGLFHEFKRFGKVTSVNIFDIGQNRYAVVSFRKPDQAKEALEESQDKTFFGSKIKVEVHVGFEGEDGDESPSEAELDEYHTKATRTLFVGNLEKDVTTQTLTSLFSAYGEILDMKSREKFEEIDIKCPYQGAVTAYSFIQYPDIKSVVKAQKSFNGEVIGSKAKLGFGKSMPSGTVWLDCLPEDTTLDFVGNMFSRYGMVHFIFIDKPKGQALIFYEDLEPARRACNDVRGRPVNGSRIQVDFASRECEDHFFDRLESSGQLMPGDRPSLEARNALQKNALQARQNFQQNQGGGMRGGMGRGGGGGFNGQSNFSGPGQGMRF